MKASVDHSLGLLGRAGKAVQESAANPGDAQVAIILTGAAFEGFLNEVANIAGRYDSEPTSMALAEILKEAEDGRLQPVFKYRLAILALAGRLPSRGDLLIQDLHSLFGVRNFFTHVKPAGLSLREDGAFVPDGKEPQFISHLLNRKIVEVPLTVGFTWQQVLSTQAVGRWGHNAALAALKELARVTPDGKLKSMLAFRLDGRAPLQ